MEDFIEKQIKKEVDSGKKLGRLFLWCLVIFWGFMGIVMITTPAWILGIIFIFGSGYVGYRLYSSKKLPKNDLANFK